MGYWKADRQHGRGKLVKKNGDVYEGNFKNGLPDGEMIIHYADGAKFKGIYKAGKRNGKAIEESKDGVRFEGAYTNDERDGDFVEKDRNGQITARGTYDMGLRNEK